MPKPALRRFAPFLDEQLIAVGHVDLTARGRERYRREKLSEYAKLKDEEIAGPKKEVGDWLAA